MKMTFFHMLQKTTNLNPTKGFHYWNVLWHNYSRENLTKPNRRFRTFFKSRLFCKQAIGLKKTELNGQLKYSFHKTHYSYFYLINKIKTPEPRTQKKGTFDTNAAINSEGSGDMSSTQYNQIWSSENSFFRNRQEFASFLKH